MEYVIATPKQRGKKHGYVMATCENQWRLMTRGGQLILMEEMERY
jgi:hypothetical protein